MPDPKELVTIRCSRETRRKLRILAAMRDEGMNDTLDWVIAEGLRQALAIESAHDPTLGGLAGESSERYDEE